jgi:antitoxin component YwqK of YwqJK toxin-antitoxin module
MKIKIAKALTYIIIAFSGLSVVTVGCHKAPPPAVDPTPKLMSINILDRNGMSEIINNPERLGQYSNVDFTLPQPYQKVLRIFSRDCQGNIPAIITSYHDNGTPRQYLEVMNTRAFGMYREWHPNGQMKLEGKVIEGSADIADGCEKSWIFDGCARAWSECGTLDAEIYYDKGNLTGMSTYYHENGTIWKSIPYCKNLVDGIAEIHYCDGSLLQKISFVDGIKNGEAQRFWQDGSLAAQEEYCEGQLVTGRYYDKCGNLISSIDNGNGRRAIFNKDCVCEFQEYKQGMLEGTVEVLDRFGRASRIYNVKDDTKHGEEVIFYDAPKLKENLQPKILVTWYDGKIQGPTKTWYPNGIQESQKEMSNNKKNGHSTAWYRDGSLMMIEEYEQDKLARGEYYSRGEKFPISMVIDGKGVVTRYDSDGTFLQRITYKQGKPQLEE